MGFLLALLSLLIGLVQPSGGSSDGGVTVEVSDASAAAPADLPRVYGSPDPSRPLIVIDPGHGGHDPGATSPFGPHPEKAVTLAIATAIRDALAASGRVRVALTREDDRFLVLQDRYGIARRMGADLFISVHADAAPHNDNARGATIYTLSEVASDREAALLAQRQNAVGAVAGARLVNDAGVNRILIDLAQRESMDVSARFAALLHREGSAYFPFRPDYHRFASLIVLKAPDVPSVLFETGYLTNPADAAYIDSPEGQKRIAAGIRSAVESHFARRLVRVAAR